MRILLVILLSAFCVVAFGQPGGGNPPGDPGEPVPFSGLWILLAAGAWLGIRSFRNRKSES